MEGSLGIGGQCKQFHFLSVQRRGGLVLVNISKFYIAIYRQNQYLKTKNMQREL